jgi:hypothetical protein
MDRSPCPIEHGVPCSDEATLIRETSCDRDAPSFSLRRTWRGVCVERRLALKGRREFSYVSFENETTFARWCESDKATLAHPHLHLRLRRAVKDILYRDFSRTG